MAGKRAKESERSGADRTQGDVSDASTTAASETAAASAGQAVTVALPPDFRMAAQAAFKQQLISALASDAIVLDGSAVERVDTAALQLLVVFQRELDARGCAPSWQAASPALTEAADVLGLIQTLKMPAPALA